MLLKLKTKLAIKVKSLTNCPSQKIKWHSLSEMDSTLKFVCFLFNRYMNAAKIGEDVLITAQVLKQGRTLAFATVDLTNKANGKLIAQGRHTKHLGSWLITCRVTDMKCCSLLYNKLQHKNLCTVRICSAVFISTELFKQWVHQNKDKNPPSPSTSTQNFKRGKKK